MKDKLSILDMAVLAILARVRGIRVATLLRYAKLKAVGKTEALRKRLDRLCEKGYLASSSLPSGPKIYRLSQKGREIMGAPPSFASSPSSSIAAEMLSASSFGCNGDFIFPTKTECDSLLLELKKEDVPPKMMGRLVLRRMKCRDRSGQTVIETHLHLWLAELRPADALCERVETIVQNLSQAKIFQELIAAGLFGVTIVVPSTGVKASLEAKVFPVETSIEVLEELQNVAV